RPRACGGGAVGRRPAGAGAAASPSRRARRRRAVGGPRAGRRARRAALELGERTDAVLERLRDRTAGAPGAAGRGFELIVAAILLQHRAGGDLARLLREAA